MSHPKLAVTGVIALIAVAALAATGALKSNKNEGPKAIPVTRGTLVDKALAVGTIEPRVEVSVKSTLGGVVRRQFAQVGDYVRRGEPLLEISPNPTPLALVELKRSIDLKEIALQNLQEDLERQRQLRNQDLISQADFEMAERKVAEARTELELARDRLALQQAGRLDSAGSRLESVVRAPIDGYVLDKSVEIGDPVTPLTDYQEGTVLMHLAAMRDLIFRGTVDEIDVGRLNPGMPVNIKIGALPDAVVKGRLEKIWLKATKQEQATVFPIEIRLTQVNGATLRAGYSANAEVIVARRDSVLMVPERVLGHRGDTSFVTMRAAGGKTEERQIKTGLSDAINIEVLAGLSAQDSVLEPPPREIH
ncbi:MAG TPA: efflux RND transporter periplasmic adaptor subunit [Gemmatimonadales bacterium]|nr:efflux RND transporter periplasmic adaptor subunit [Gemmatimonadales bacterium]